MPEYIITVFNGKKEIPLLGLLPGQVIDLDEYHCRHIYPQDWHFYKSLLAFNPIDAELTGFLEMGYELRIYRKKST